MAKNRPAKKDNNKEKKHVKMLHVHKKTYKLNNGKSKCNLELASSLFFSSEKDDEGIIREQ